MRTIAASAEFPCSPETFWVVFLDEAYLQALHLEELECPEFAILEAGEASRKLRIAPKLGLPAPLASLVGGTFVYEDHGSLDRNRGLWTWRMVQPSDLGAGSEARDGVLAMHGTIRVEATGDASCRRSDEVTIEANLFGFGTLIESTVEQEMLAARAREYAFFARWIRAAT